MRHYASNAFAVSDEVQRSGGPAPPDIAQPGLTSRSPARIARPGPTSPGPTSPGPARHRPARHRPARHRAARVSTARGRAGTGGHRAGTGGRATNAGAAWAAPRHGHSLGATVGPGPSSGGAHLPRSWGIGRPGSGKLALPTGNETPISRKLCSSAPTRPRLHESCVVHGAGADETKIARSGRF